MLKAFILTKFSISWLVSAAVSLVNPFVGTDFHGHTFPGAAYPFGMVQLSPDTRPDPSEWDGCSGYHYSDSLIYGFSHTHLSGTGCPDLLDVMVMPVAGFQKPVNRTAYASPFSHLKEKASPGYYEVYLERPGVKARLTVGRRTGMHEYTFPQGAAPQIIIDLTHRDSLLEGRIEKTSASAIQGLRRSRGWAQDQSVYFYVEASEPMESVVQDGGKAILLNFAPAKTGKAKTVTLRVGISSVSEANARENLKMEYPKDFQTQKAAAEKAWEAFLGKAECPSQDAEIQKNFYTALYHSAIHPSLYSDYNGEYRGMDRKVHKAVTTDGQPYEQYTIFSLWDTFRALNPLLMELEPARSSDFINSFLAIFREAGKLPIWELWGNETNCMIGYNSAPVILEAIRRDIPGFNRQEALEALLVSSKNPAFGLESFRRNGLVLEEESGESVSKTLEYAYDDWCVAQVAKRLGREKEYEEYMTSAQYWRNVFDPETGFMRGRWNGKWVTPFSPTDVTNFYTEANSWQYSFFVPQDIAGLMEAMGGKEAFLEKIEALFNAPDQTTGRFQSDITGLIGQYAHGNEPSHHIVWIPELLGRKDMTERLSQKVLTTLYTPEPDGLCGNDDCGQMSAWYVLSLLRKYPVCPGADLGTLTSIKKTIVVNPAFQYEGEGFRDGMEVTLTGIEKDARAFIRKDGGAYEAYSGSLTLHEPCTLEAYAERADGTRSFTVRTIIK